MKCVHKTQRWFLLWCFECSLDYSCCEFFFPLSTRQYNNFEKCVWKTLIAWKQSNEHTHTHTRSKSFQCVNRLEPDTSKKYSPSFLPKPYPFFLLSSWVCFECPLFCTLLLIVSLKIKLQKLCATVSVPKLRLHKSYSKLIVCDRLYIFLANK